MPSFLRTQYERHYIRTTGTLSSSTNNYPGGTVYVVRIGKKKQGSSKKYKNRAAVTERRESRGVGFFVVFGFQKGQILYIPNERVAELERDCNHTQQNKSIRALVVGRFFCDFRSFVTNGSASKSQQLS